MTTPTRTAGAVDLTAAPRAVLRLLNWVLGEGRLGSSRGNAWEAMIADRARAQERAEVARLLANHHRS